MSTIGVKAIKYPDGDSAIDITDGGNVTLAGTLGVTGVTTMTSITVGDGHTIGNQSVSDNLEIKSSSGENIVYNSHYGGHIFYNDGTENFRINDDGEARLTGNITKPSGDLTIDVAGDINIDADGGDVNFKDGGTTYGFLAKYNNDLWIGNSISNGDITFRGNDGGSNITALTLDMSAAGMAIFSGGVNLLSSAISFSGSISTPQTAAAIFRPADNTLAISTANNERMRIDNQGRVGIGTSSPTQSFSLGFADLGSGAIEFRTSTYAQMAKIVGSHDSGTAEGSMRFHTRTGGNEPERMRIDAYGNLLIGTTSSQGLGTTFYGNTTNGFFIKTTSTCGYLVGPAGANTILTFYAAATSVGGITTNGSTTTFGTTSDHRVKENVVTEWDATTRLKQLKPCRFNFISDETNTLVDGFLAHEAQAVVPECVTGTHNEVDADGNAVMQAIDQSKIVPLLTKTLQEALTRIDTLEAEVKALKG